MQHVVPALEDLSIDVAALTRRRDALTPVLAAAGYRPLQPECTFYLVSRWPQGDRPCAGTVLLIETSS